MEKLAEKLGNVYEMGYNDLKEATRGIQEWLRTEAARFEKQEKLMRDMRAKMRRMDVELSLARAENARMRGDIDAIMNRKVLSDYIREKYDNPSTSPVLRQNTPSPASALSSLELSSIVSLSSISSPVSQQSLGRGERVRKNLSTIFEKE